MEKVLFVCTHNSARSQMAEGFLRHHANDRFEAFSAGTEPGALHPLAVQVMAEEGVDISGHRAKSLDALLLQPFEYVITVSTMPMKPAPSFRTPYAASTGASLIRRGPRVHLTTVSRSSAP